MILTGSQIELEHLQGNIIINPWRRERLNPNSYNLQLARRLYYYTPDMTLDMENHVDPLGPINIDPDQGFVLQPGHLYLGKTEEWTETYGFVPVLDGRSSIGRLGVFVHVTAGFGDLGFRGNWTLEICCVVPVRIFPTEFCQIRYHTVYGKIDRVYQGKYQDSKNIVPSLLHEELKRHRAAQPPKEECC